MQAVQCEGNTWKTPVKPRHYKKLYYLISSNTGTDTLQKCGEHFGVEMTQIIVNVRVDMCMLIISRQSHALSHIDLTAIYLSDINSLAKYNTCCHTYNSNSNNSGHISPLRAWAYWLQVSLSAAEVNYHAAWTNVVKTSSSPVVIGFLRQLWLEISSYPMFAMIPISYIGRKFHSLCGTN